MSLYYFNHRVKDYDVWRTYFDADDAARVSIGTTCVSVLRSTANANNISLVFDVEDINVFMNFMQAPERGEIMQKAGVLEMPKIYKLEEIKR